MSASSEAEFDEESRVTYNPSNPGCVPIRTFGRFVPDGKGGGLLTYFDEVVEMRKGFRPKVKVVERTVRKEPRFGTENP